MVLPWKMKMPWSCWRLPMTWATGGIRRDPKNQGIRRVEHGKHVEDPRVEFVTFVWSVGSKLLSFSWTSIFKPIRFGRGWWNWHFWTFGGYCSWLISSWNSPAGGVACAQWEMMEHDGTWSKLAAGMSFEVIMGMSNDLVGGLKHFSIFPFHIWVMSSFPLTNSYFSRWLLHHQPAICWLFNWPNSQSFFVGNPSTTDTDFCVFFCMWHFGAGGNMWKHVETSYGTFFCKMVSNPHS